MRRSLFWRLSLFFLVFASVISLIFWMLQLYGLPSLITRRTAEQLSSEATSVASLTNEAPSLEVLLQALSAREINTPFFITLYQQNGDIVYSTMTQTPLRLIEQDRLRSESSFTLVTIRQNLPYLNHFSTSGSYVVRIATPLQTYDQQLSLINQLFFGALSMSLVLALAFAWQFSRTLTKPLKQLQETVSSWENFHQTQPVAIEGTDEIAVLSKTFHDLSLRLKGTYQQLEEELNKATELEQAQKNFLAQASHELKTPLAILSASLETLMDGVLKNPNDQHTLYDSMVEETHRMQRLIDQLLQLTKLQSTDSVIAFTPCDMQQMTMAIIERLALIYPLKPILNVRGEHFVIQGDEPALWLALRNLTENALQHKAAHGSVVITIEECETHLIWTIQNSCDGAVLDKASNLFKPFVKGNPSSSGHGLGLALVKRVVDAHQAKLSLEANTHFTVTITLKRTPSPHH